MTIPQERRKGRFISNILPRFSSTSSAEREKYASYAAKMPWIVAIPVPSLPTRRICCINSRKLHALIITRFGRRRGWLFIFVLFFFFAVIVKVLVFRKERHTLVFSREDLQRIWHWEISSGHFPSRQAIPEEMQLRVPIENPALPPHLVSDYLSEYATTTRGTGARRSYFDLKSAPANVGFPPRPVPGSIADLDIVMQHCAFERNKFVRDCLEVLRVGAGLDNGKKMRRGKLDDWKYIYLEQPQNATFETSDIQDLHAASPDIGGGLRKPHGEDWETSPTPLRHPPRYVSPSSNPAYCDPESPRIFHMFWAGEFTDKPYLALLSFLFTQNTGLHLKTYPADAPCRSQFWVWISPGPAVSIPNPNALNDMLDHLKSNPWSSPFLHPRFKDIIKFKMWNTTEQLDHIPELKDEWRTRDLLTSVGKSHKVPGISRVKGPVPSEGIYDDPQNIANPAGSKSSDAYDRLSVILSDLARFILCHRFGGIYLDADILLLRDWEELWGWKGAFAYRWSRMERYNTAVLRLNKDSALGSFIFKTALKNKMDFHPHTIWKYVKDAHLEDLLLRLPDALFDSAWLNTEGFQVARPPQPFFTDFKHFFETPGRDSAAPQALGFEGFFRGAYGYHYHNFWWKPFDPSRNWPDLGPRFLDGEMMLNSNLRPVVDAGRQGEDEADQRDLDWSTVLKRVMESYIRGERPNMYGEMLEFSDL